MNTIQLKDLSVDLLSSLCGGALHTRAAELRRCVEAIWFGNTVSLLRSMILSSDPIMSMGIESRGIQ